MFKRRISTENRKMCLSINRCQTALVDLHNNKIYQYSSNLSYIEKKDREIIRILAKKLTSQQKWCIIIIGKFII